MDAKDIRQFCFDLAAKAAVSNPTKVAADLAGYFVRAKDFATAKRVIQSGDGQTAAQIIKSGELAVAFIDGSTAQSA